MIHVRTPSDQSQHTSRNYNDPLPGLIYCLECNYATLDQLEIRSRTSKSDLRRQRAICDHALFTVMANCSETIVLAKELRCGRVVEAMKVPTFATLRQTEDRSAIIVRWRDVSMVVTLRKAGEIWRAELVVGEKILWEDSARSTKTGRDTLSKEVTQAILYALEEMPDAVACNRAFCNIERFARACRDYNL